VRPPPESFDGTVTRAKRGVTVRSRSAPPSRLPYCSRDRGCRSRTPLDRTVDLRGHGGPPAGPRAKYARRRPGCRRRHGRFDPVRLHQVPSFSILAVQHSVMQRGLSPKGFSSEICARMRGEERGCGRGLPSMHEPTS